MANESTTEVAFAVDTIAPTIDVTATNGAIAERGVPLPLIYSCDDGTGSGIASCAGPVPTGVSVDTSALGTFTVAVQAVDVAGNSSLAQVTYTVAEHTGEPSTLVLDSGVNPIDTDFTAVVTPSGEDTHTVTIDWGDPSDASGGLTHSYATPGVYTVTATITHSRAPDEVVTALAVVYDPAEGFVTGGGWFDSPLNSFTPDDASDEEVGGVAEFGFVSKYKKGATVPTGNTVFELITGDFLFESTSYDWLVVNGDSRPVRGRRCDYVRST